MAKTTLQNKLYPNPCSRCGFCCIAETCPVGQKMFGVERFGQCPGLKFEGDKATCSAYSLLCSGDMKKAEIEEILGIGKGCCIKARAFKDGVAYDFASIPKDMKIKIVSGL